MKDTTHHPQQHQQAGRMGRNPFAQKSVPAAKSPVSEKSEARESRSTRATHDESSLIEKLVIEIPIHLVFMGIKSWMLLREVVRSTVFEQRSHGA